MTVTEFNDVHSGEILDMALLLQEFYNIMPDGNVMMKDINLLILLPKYCLVLVQNLDKLKKLMEANFGDLV